MMLTQRKNDRPRYRLQDAGYATLKRIHQGKERRGHVTRNSDGVYTARIGTVEVQAPSEADAFRHVVAKVEGLDVSEIRHDVLHQKKVQADTEIILDWLKTNAAKHGGRLAFSNNDLAHAIGKRKPDRALGNVVSRLDFGCYLTGLPALGCAAEETFRGAWQQRQNRSWDFPVELMQRRAKTHRWSAADLDRVRHETQRMIGGRAHLVWNEEIAKHEAGIRTWAETC
jgi:hypothetical protein